MKTFTSRPRPAEGEVLPINDQRFQLEPSVPGAVLLDFLLGADSDDASSLAKTVHSLLDVAIVEADKERFQAYIRVPEHNIDLPMLSEIAGEVARVLSGNAQEPTPFGAG